METWSPPLALNAYLHTLQLCKTKKTSNTEDTSQKMCETIIEPKCMEFISALAVGNRARRIMEITSKRLTPLTMALAVAAKQTGHLVCVVLQDNVTEVSQKRQNANLIKETNLEDVIELVYGDPCAVMIEYKNIDFLVVDGKLDGHLKFFQMIDLNPMGSIIERHNLACDAKD